MCLVRVRVLIGSFVLVAASAVPGAFNAAAGLGTGAVPAQEAAKLSPGAGPVIVVETEKGTFEFETYPNEAPKTVAHILGLVKKRFYNGQRVHRVVPGFVAQLGDPQSRDMTLKAQWGTKGSGTPIGAGEFSKLRTHVRGAVAMAYAGAASSADSQFYITLAATPQLDGKYAVFGKVLSGMDVVAKLAIGDRVIRATVKEAK